MIKSLMLRYLPNGSAGHSVSLLFGGSTIGQLAAVLALPILTRLYQPDDFGVLATYMSILFIVSGVAGFRYELAIPLVRRDSSAINLLVLSALCVFFTLLCSSIFVVLFFRETPLWLDLSKIAPFLWFVPMGIFLSGMYQVFNYWAIRQKDFSVVAGAKVSQSVGCALVQAGYGVLHTNVGGLMLGTLVGQGLGLTSLLRGFWLQNSRLLMEVKWYRIKRLAWACRRFPKYSILDAFANNSSTYLPLLIIASCASGAEAGFFMLAMRVMQLPLGLLGNSVSQVYLSHAPLQFKAGKLPAFTAGVLIRLIQFGVGPIVFIGIVASDIFVFVFGVDWGRSAELLSWMLPWFLLQLLGSPVSMVMHVIGRQKLMLILTLFGLCVRLTGVGWAAVYQQNFLSEVFAITSAIYYLAVCVVCVGAAGIKGNEYILMVKACFWPVVFWLFLVGSIKFANVVL